MTFRLNDDLLQSDSSDAVYRTKHEFRQVLTTLSDDVVPRALILLGLLTEQLDPIESDAERQIRIASENVDRAPTANVSASTVDAVMWLLYEVKASLDSERKQTIGKLLSTASLDTPTVSDSTTGGVSETESANSDQSKSAETTPTELETQRDATSDTAAKLETKSKTDTTSGQNDSETVECEFCGAPFTAEGALMSHSIQCTERSTDARFQCKYCENEYVSRKALSTHLEDCGAKERAQRATRDSSHYTCTSCGEVFDSPQQLIEHRHTDQCDHRQRTRHRLVKRQVTGAVVDFNPNGGYGFIRSSDFIQMQDTQPARSDDLFFHVNDYPGSEATVGEQLRFDIRQTDDGYRAVNISRVQQKRVDRWGDTFASDRPRWGGNS